MRKFDVLAAKRRLLSQRKKLRLSQEELGGRFGMSRSGFSTAENPDNHGVFFTIEQIMNLKYEMGLSYDYIIEGNEGPHIKREGRHEENRNENDLVKENEHLKEKVNDQKEIIESLKAQIKLLKGES